MGNPIPTQVRSIDPYASYNSDIANRLTRIVTDGEDCLLSPSPIEVEAIDSTSVVVTSGKAVKDDVLIEIQSLNVDLTDGDFFVDSTAWNEIGYYYVVLTYTYSKVQPPPTASIGVIRPSKRATLYNPNTMLFLACLDVSGYYQVDNILNYDPDNPSIGRKIVGGVVGGQATLITGDYTASPNDALLAVSGNTTITLPPSSVSETEIRIIKIDSSATVTTVAAHSGDKIDDETSIQMTEQWNEVTLWPDGITTWVEV